MAQEPKKNGKGSGKARVVKDKVVYLLAEGAIQNVSVVLTPEDVLDAKEQNPNLTYKKVVIPVKRRATQPAQPAAA